MGRSLHIYHMGRSGRNSCRYIYSISYCIFIPIISDSPKRTVQMEIIKNAKGGEKLCFGGFMYTKNGSSLSRLDFVAQEKLTKLKTFITN